MGTKFTTKFLYVQSGDRVKKLFYSSKRIKEIGTNVTGSGTFDIFLFTFFDQLSFFLFISTLFSVDLWST